MSHKQPGIGINGFLVRNNTLLLGKRKNGFGAGTWGLPGGHLEIGESWAEAMLRELKEETGIVGIALTVLNVINDPDCGAHYIHVNFLITEWEGEPYVPKDEQDKLYEWRWFDLDNLPDNIFGGHTKIIKAYLNGEGPIIDSK